MLGITHSYRLVCSEILKFKVCSGSITLHDNQPQASYTPDLPPAVGTTHDVVNGYSALREEGR